jgi:hypothetical protein
MVFQKNYLIKNLKNLITEYLLFFFKVKSNMDCVPRPLHTLILDARRPTVTWNEVNECQKKRFRCTNAMSFQKKAAFNHLPHPTTRSFK